MVSQCAACPSISQPCCPCIPFTPCTHCVYCILCSLLCRVYNIHCTLHMSLPSQPLCIVKSTLPFYECTLHSVNPRSISTIHYLLGIMFLSLGPRGANLSKFSLLTQRLPPRGWYCHWQQCAWCITVFVAIFCLVHLLVWTLG